MGNGISHVTVVFRLPFVFARDVTETISAAQILTTDGYAVTNLWPGMSAPVRDAVIRAKGGFTAITLIGAGGSSFSFGGVAAGSYLRFETATGRAFITPNDVWAGGTEVTSTTSNGPGPYFFEIGILYAAGDPSQRHGGFSVFTAGRTSNPSIQVKGRGAYER